MKVRLVIEQFDNGITMKFHSLDNYADDLAVIASDSEKKLMLGKYIWDDIENFMNNNASNNIEISYTIKNIENENH